jgi:hypothetical protein
MEKWHAYLKESAIEANYATRCYAEFETARSSNEVSSIFYTLHHFLVHVTNIDKLINPNPGSRRANLLSGRLDLTGIDLKPFRRLRNHLEHFDERLEAWLENYEGHAFFDRNIVTGAKGFPSKAFLRAIDGDIFKFHDEDYNLNVLYDAVQLLSTRLQTALSNEA